MLKNHLVATWPDATITFINRSIGACTSACIVNKVETEIGTLSADLVIFHTFFDTPEDSYENCLIKMKQHSPPGAEILVFNDPVHDVQSQNWHDLWSFQLLPKLCVKHGAGMVNIRRPWQLYLAAHHGNKYNAAGLTYDGVHFNEEGNHVMFETIKRYFKHHNATSAESRHISGRAIEAIAAHGHAGRASTTYYDLIGKAVGPGTRQGHKGIFIVKNAQSAGKTILW